MAGSPVQPVAPRKAQLFTVNPGYNLIQMPRKTGDICRILVVYIQ
jgi:hypothetical protein